MFYAHFLISKRGPLAKIWLAAHWDKKLTKAHVFECNLETTIESIISPKVTIALRTSGHLLLGVVRIYHRKAKYLLADCNEALIKMKMAFRPGVVDLPEENLEATYKAITLPEEFHDFDMNLPDLNAIDVAEHFTLNQSRAEEITLREDYDGFNLHGGSFGEGVEIFRQSNLFDDNLTMSANSLFPEHSSASLTGDREVMNEDGEVFKQDGFGDEGAAGDMLDNLLNDEQGALIEDILDASKDISLPPAPPEGVISAMASMGKKKSKRKRKLLVDTEKELSSSTMRKQLTDFLDTVTTVDFAPPTRKLMIWKETGGAEKLLSNPSQSLIHAKLIMLFTRCLIPHSIRNDNTGEDLEPEREEIRKQEDIMEMPVLEETSYLQESRLTDTSMARATEASVMDFQNGRDQEGNKADELLEPMESEQDSEERRWNKRAHHMLNMLRHINKTGVMSFSLLELCKDNNRKQASAKFYSFLVLKKQLAIELSQSAPYADIIATPGPRFSTI